MLSSKLDIWNMAISHLGESIEVGTDRENTAQARACRRFYDICREKALRDAPWPFAKRYTLLAEVTTTIPVSEFKYAYRYPADALFIRRILNTVTRNETAQSRIPYRLVSDSIGKVILCDVQPIANATDASLSIPWMEYTVNVTDENRFDSDFSEALALLLATRISPRVAGDKSKLRSEAAGLYKEAITKAQINAFQEEVKDEEVQSEFERSRDGWDWKSSHGFCR